jgi:hypothetical protein
VNIREYLQAQGRKGGRSRAKNKGWLKISPEDRKRIASNAINARWAKRDKKEKEG